MRLGYCSRSICVCLVLAGWLHSGLVCPEALAGGPEKATMPPGDDVRFEQRGYWELYRWQILGVASLCVVQALLIAGLLVQRASRWRAEKRFQQALETTRQGQLELRELTGKLLVAQETERRRIARELHDDLSQSLAVLAVELDILAQQAPGKETPTRIEELSTKVKELSSTVHELSHQLHPAKLEQLGLVAAIVSLCKDLSQSHGLTISVKHHEVAGPISDDAALCLYRIAQESLHNVIKHSGARQALVELIGDAGSIRLRVVDDGKGFESNLVGKGGLGLVSMRERLHLVRGEIAIDSQPAAGTRIEVRIPLGVVAETAGV